MDSSVLNLKKWVEQEHKTLLEEAQGASDMFWSVRDHVIENISETAKPRLGCRIQSDESSISINWFYHDFYVHPVSKKVKRTNVHIKKPKNKYKYSLSKLYKYSAPSLNEMVDYTESVFANIRERSDKLRKLKIWIKSYEDTLKKNESINEEKKEDGK